MTNLRRSTRRAPLTDAIAVAVAQLVDDAQTARREPSHSDIDREISRSGLTAGDPKADGQIVGKAKRIRSTLSWAIEHDLVAGETLVGNLISHITGLGGFRTSSQNYVGLEAVRNAASAFRTEGTELTEEGELRPILLDNLSGAPLTEALYSYVRRAKRGAHDAALVTGTGKDLLEATAAYILMERYGAYPPSSNFPTLLGQAFNEVGLATTEEKPLQDEAPQKRLERAMYDMACSINNLRNKEGTGHGRPWLPTVTEVEARTAVECMGIIAERLLQAHKGNRTHL